jgi:hypothetical protein
MKSAKLSALALAVALGCAAPVRAQPDVGALPQAGTSKQAEYDCSGMTWTPLENCLKLNADNARTGSANARAGSTTVANSPRGATHDCSGMIGAPLETCRKLNGQAVETPNAATANSARGTTGLTAGESE